MRLTASARTCNPHREAVTREHEPEETQYRVGTHVVDLREETIAHGDDKLALTPKAFHLLSFFMEHPRRLLTKKEILDAVWPEAFVGDAVLKVAVREIRKVLGDQIKAPEYIETVHRRGYRFLQEPLPLELATRESSPAQPTSSGLSRTAPTSAPAVPIQASRTFVGRDDALVRLEKHAREAASGLRRVLFISGEAGVGKTSLIDVFLERMGPSLHARIARGECLEQFREGEAYLPVLVALERLAREEGETLRKVLTQHAPTWLLQLPSLLERDGKEELREETLGATRERMLREINTALEALTQDRPLILVLEDLHWSDTSTLDLVAALVRRTEPARLLVLLTYRPVEVIVRAHPLKALKQGLLVHHQCEEVDLEWLREKDVHAYLERRFENADFPKELPRLIHERTDGNPLFMVNLLDYFVAQMQIVDDGERARLAVTLDELREGVPDSVRQMIEKQIERLDPEEQRILEACSIAGAEFGSDRVAAALSKSVTEIEDFCEEFRVREEFLNEAGVEEMGDQIAARYAFIHDSTVMRCTNESPAVAGSARTWPSPNTWRPRWRRAGRRRNVPESWPITTSALANSNSRSSTCTKPHPITRGTTWIRRHARCSNGP